MSDTSFWIVDASPIVTLAKVGRASLLKHLPKRTLIPEQVESEIISGPEGDPAKAWLLALDRSEHIISVSNVPSSVEECNVGRGESAVLAAAVQRSPATAILDDGKARKCARELQVATRGTLGVLLLAKQKGEIDEVQPVMEDLLSAGLYVSRALYEHVLDLASEL